MKWWYDDKDDNKDDDDEDDDAMKWLFTIGNKCCICCQLCCLGCSCCFCCLCCRLLFIRRSTPLWRHCAAREAALAVCLGLRQRRSGGARRASVNSVGRLAFVYAVQPRPLLCSQPPTDTETDSDGRTDERTHGWTDRGTDRIRHTKADINTGTHRQEDTEIPREREILTEMKTSMTLQVEYRHIDGGK